MDQPDVLQRTLLERLYIFAPKESAITSRLSFVVRRLDEHYEVIARMRIRYYIDPETDEPHIYGHDVTETECEEVLASPAEDRPGRAGSRVALGQTRSGRYLRVIYIVDAEPESLFVITAYELRGKPLLALKRRRRRKRS